MSEEKVVKMPVNMSAGGDNMFVVHCRQLGQQKAYASCLHINARLRDGTLNQDLYADCERAIKQGSCEAVDMRAQEIEGDEALFYRPKRDVSIPVTKVDKSSMNYARGWNRVSGKTTDDLPEGRFAPQVKSKMPEKSGVVIEDVDYGKLVEAMAAEERNASEAEPPATKPTEKKIDPVKAIPQKSKPIIGGSLLDIARQQRGLE